MKADNLKGGLADEKQPSDFDFEQLVRGTKVELEHSDNEEVAMEIAMDHLSEDPQYYEKLTTIEESDSESCPLRHSKRGYGNIPTWGGYQAHTELEIGLGRLSEALHCILGSLSRAMQDREQKLEQDMHHIREELFLVKKILNEYSQKLYLDHFNNHYDEETKNASLESIINTSNKLLSITSDQISNLEKSKDSIKDKIYNIALNTYNTLEKLSLSGQRFNRNKNPLKNKMLYKSVQKLEDSIIQNDDLKETHKKSVLKPMSLSGHGHDLLQKAFDFEKQRSKISDQEAIFNYVIANLENDPMHYNFLRKNLNEMSSGGGGAVAGAPGMGTKDKWSTRKMYSLKEYVLTENREQFLRKTYKEKLIKFVSAAYQNDIEQENEPIFRSHEYDMIGFNPHKPDESAEQIFNFFLEIDPTVKKSYAQWLILRFLKDKIHPEDLSTLDSYLKTFEDLKNRNILRGADINQMSVGELISIVEDNADKMSDREKKGKSSSAQEEIWEKEIDIIYNEDNYLVAIPQTQRAACILGKETRWCTAVDSDSNMFDTYNKQGSLYVIYLKKENEKYQLHFDTNQFMDANDRPVDKSEFFTKHDDLVPIIYNHWNDNASRIDKLYNKTKYNQDLIELFEQITHFKENQDEPDQAIEDIISFSNIPLDSEFIVEYLPSTNLLTKDHIETIVSKTITTANSSSFDRTARWIASGFLPLIKGIENKSLIKFLFETLIDEVMFPNNFADNTEIILNLAQKIGQKEHNKRSHFPDRGYYELFIKMMFDYIDKNWNKFNSHDLNPFYILNKINTNKVFKRTIELQSLIPDSLIEKIINTESKGSIEAKDTSINYLKEQINTEELLEYCVERLNNQIPTRNNAIAEIVISLPLEENKKLYQVLSNNYDKDVVKFQYEFFQTKLALQKTEKTIQISNLMDKESENSSFKTWENFGAEKMRQSNEYKLDKFYSKITGIRNWDNFDEKK